ncbi:hypothetical protein CSOJ01_12634 [Colletotrichum sojae]|uniref:Uncharacterized protein n=1 Tax=Colletotrichum sojae TaxID=2175907 RepID=A0A8H6MMC7_9PEZI|nr:hypothetical protein CSOJ01_12634 [Colletotrichum sojae]
MADKNGGQDFPGHPDDEYDEEEAVGGLEDDIFFRGNYARKPAGQNFRRPLDPDSDDGEGTRSLMAPLEYKKPSGWAKAAKKTSKRAGSFWPCFGMRLRSRTMSGN